MKITAISVYRLDLPVSGGEYTYGTGSFRSSEATIVEVSTDEGLAGWGECTPVNNTYAAVHPAAVRAGIETMAPHLIGCNPLEIEKMYSVRDAAMSGHDYAKSAVDMACWDFLGKACQLPLYVLLGGRFMQRAPLYKVVNTDAPQKMIEQYHRYRKQGYRIFQLKVGMQRDTEHACFGTKGFPLP